MEVSKEKIHFLTWNWLCSIQNLKIFDYRVKIWFKLPSITACAGFGWERVNFLHNCFHRAVLLFWSENGNRDIIEIFIIEIFLLLIFQVLTCREAKPFLFLPHLSSEQAWEAGRVPSWESCSQLATGITESQSH